MSGSFWGESFPPGDLASLVALIQGDIRENDTEVQKEEEKTAQRKAKNDEIVVHIEEQTPDAPRARRRRSAQPAKPKPKPKPKPRPKPKPKPAQDESAQATKSKPKPKSRPKPKPKPKPKSKPKPARSPRRSSNTQKKAQDNENRLINAQASAQRMQDALDRLHTEPHPDQGRLVRLKRTLPRLSRDISWLIWQPADKDEPNRYNDNESVAIQALPSLANLECEVVDWFDHRYGRSVWRYGSEPEDPTYTDTSVEQTPYCDDLGEFSLPAMVFKLRLAAQVSKGPRDTWLNNDVVCVRTTDGLPLLVLDSEISGRTRR